ncbi:MAG: aminomethyl-transferring glycine dehydrogenase subunit GcvPB [Clostridiales bacterium]|nr:aminomethyl-transferring glycine dehydrogenase subunit GcvPB [Clostridiales bacterium]
MLTIYQRSKIGAKSFEAPFITVPKYALDDKYLGKEETILPSVSEIDIVRHYTKLSQNAFGVDNGFYPLGSCTMKYNPKLNEITASLDGFTSVHPLQEEKSVQGCLCLMYELSQQLKAITGMNFSLQPAAGAHGELAGLMIMKAYHESRNDFKRTKIIIPNSAHGTNPASAALAGMEIINIPSLDDGSVDIIALKNACGDDTAGFMLTNPNTLGLFEEKIMEINKIVHKCGGLMYYDGANLNAIMGIARPLDMGFDIMHINLHKTFSTPHGGGGPGSGPVGCADFLQQFLPSPIVIKENDNYIFHKPSKSIGKVKNFYGNFLVMVKAYTYILTLGAEGIVGAAQKAVLNANYLKEKLREIYYTKGSCMHEFVLSMQKVKEDTKVTALDIAKAMIDKNIHPPTMYFPAIVQEALMFEPTETESKTTLDNAAKVIIDIVKKAYVSADELHSAPKKAYITRPDETLAARNPKLRIDLAKG